VAATGAYVAVGQAQDYGGWRGHGGMHGRGMTMMFDQLDLNGDGSVSKAEFEQFRSERLQKYDANGDGALSLEEFQPLFAEITRPMMVRGFQFFDADGDGKVTQEELTKPTDRMFQRMDRDGDGVLTPVTPGMREGMRGEGMRGHGPRGQEGHGERQGGQDRD
jgi:hypothetical protein